MNGRMIVAKSFLLSLIVFPAQAIQIQKREIKKIEKLIYAFVNGARNLYGPERISRSVLKAPKELGGIGGVDVDVFIKAIAVKQFEKAARTHRILGSIQGLVEAPLDEVGREARSVFRSNCRNFAEVFSVPNLNQIELLSGIPLMSLLSPLTNAARTAAQEDITSLGMLQVAFNDPRRARTRISIILKALPKSIARLIRDDVLIQIPSKLAWFSADSIILCGSVTTKIIKLSLLTSKIPSMGVKLEKIYNRADWPPPGTNYESLFKKLWEIKNPSLRNSRLKILYKDVFSNERRFRFNLTNSPACDICGQIESVEHQLLSCANAARVWSLYFRLTGSNVTSLFEVINCSGNVAQEIVKSTLIKSLIQINRSNNKSDRELVSECSYYVGIESRINRQNTANLDVMAQSLRSY